MAKEFIDITPLRKKEDNEEAREEIEAGSVPENEYLSAEEFVKEIVEPIIELQNDAKTNVKALRQNNRVFNPDENGVITLPSAETIVGIYSTLDTSKPLISIDGKMIVPLQIVSAQSGSPTYETCTVEVLTASIGSTSFSSKGTFPLTSVESGSTLFQNIDLTPYLSAGAQQVRFVATGQLTGVSGYLLFANITLSVFSLSFAADWSKPMTGSIRLGYYIGGAIAKSLFVKVDGITIVNGMNLGTAVYNQTPYTEGLEISDPRVCTHGVHTIEAWMQASDDPTKKTEILRNEIYFFADESDTTPYLVVNNLATNAQPYVDLRIFDYALFCSNESRVPFLIRGKDLEGNEIYLEHDLGDVEVSKEQQYTNSFDVTSRDTEIPVYLYFYTKIAGEEILLRNDYSLIVLDNRNNFAPTSMNSDGFIFDPKVRSNNEANRESVINRLNGQIIPSSLQNFDYINDGYVDNVFRVPAGRKAYFGYDALTGLRTAGSTASLTMEFDVKVYNIKSYEAENETILQIGNNLASDEKILGFRMLPLRAHFLTQNNRSINVQDIQWKEDERTHITVNIVYNLANKGRNYVRIFINSVMNREFEYSNDVFALGETGISIGSSTATIDVYGIRIYKQALSSQQIQQDYKAALSTATEKLAYQTKNDILGDDNTISITKTQQAGYNTLRFIADDNSKNLVANYLNKGNNLTKGTVEMLVYNADGSLNWKYCQRITHCKQKGQGTSSMTYFLWNLTFTATDTSQRFVMNAQYEWILDENVSGTDCYFLFPNGKSGRDDIKAVKNVAKANWASSMQSHKMGWCNLYTDMYWEAIGDTGINKQSKYKNCRKSVTQLPFFFFVENSEGCRFSNLMTFGPAKFDKLCWGTKATSPHYIVTKDGKQTEASIFTVLEGSANGRPLPERKIPWLTDEVHYYLNRANDDDPLNETLVYNGASQLDVDKAPMNVYEEGTDDEYEIPKGFTLVPNSTTEWEETVDTEYDNRDPYKTAGNTIKLYRRAYNFDYLHTHRLRFISGTVDALMARTDLDTDYQYWVTQGNGANEAYDLFRYNPLTKTWVNAGVGHDSNTLDGYAKLNLFTQCEPWIADYQLSYNPADPNSMNNAFIKARVQHYKDNSTQWYNEVDCDFSQAFRKFGALKDNWCKNTYESLAPDGLIGEDSDDNDTSGDLDNVGASKCPYYAEEHDRCNAEGDFDPDGTNTYWNSDTNTRYCLREEARGEEIAQMLGTILNSMAQKSGSIMACMDEYFFSTQRYFPATVYNEQARLLYEAAAVALAEGIYTNAIDPLSQNLGDHLQSELEFWGKRVAYLGSWSRCNEFANKAGTGTFSFRSGKQNATYRYTVKAHQAIYPAIMVDGTLAPITKHRMFPGETYTLDAVTVGTQDITCFLCGIDFFTSIGDLTGMAINSDVLNVSGKRLVEFKADGADANFSPGGITFAAQRLQHVEVTNVNRLSGAPDLSQCSNLERLDMRGTRITNIILPQTSTLKALYLGSFLSALVIQNLAMLSTLSVDSVEYLTSIRITQTPKADTHEIISKAQQLSFTSIGSINIDSINWTNVSPDELKWLCSIASTSLEGKMTVTEGQNVDFALKMLLLDKFGQVDSEDNQLYITYGPRAISNVNIITQRFIIPAIGDYPYEVAISPSQANNFTKVEWSLSANTLGATVDSKTGILSVPTLGSESTNPVVQLTCTVTLLNGDTMANTINIKLFNRLPKCGDFAYADGEFDSELYYGKDVVGWVYKVTEYSKLPSYLRDFYFEEDPRRLELYNQGVKLYEILVENKENVSYKTKNNATTFSSTPWGVYPDNTNGLTADERQAIADEVSAAGYPMTLAQVTDLAALTNYSSSGLVNAQGSGINHNYIIDQNAYDDAQDDGFKVITDNYSHGRWDGKRCTQLIVEHAKRILGNYAVNMKNAAGQTIWEVLGNPDHLIPETPTELADLLVALSNVGGRDQWRQIAYPAAFSCYLFEPAAKDLHPQYARGNWYLPDQGSKGRLYIYFRNSRNLTPADTGTPVAGYSDINNPSRPQESTEARRPHYANMLKRAADKEQPCPITLPSQSNSWSSTESSSNYAWFVNFNSGNTYANGKYFSYVVRPVSAFCFEL